MQLFGETVEKWKKKSKKILKPLPSGVQNLVTYLPTYTRYFFGAPRLVSVKKCVVRSVGMDIFEHDNMKLLCSL